MKPASKRPLAFAFVKLPRSSFTSRPVPAERLWNASVHFSTSSPLRNTLARRPATPVSCSRLIVPFAALSRSLSAIAFAFSMPPTIGARRCAASSNRVNSWSGTERRLTTSCAIRNELRIAAVDAERRSHSVLVSRTVLFIETNLLFVTFSVSFVLLNVLLTEENELRTSTNVCFKV